MTGLLGRWPIWDTRFLIKRSVMFCDATVCQVLTLRGLVTYYVLFFIPYGQKTKMAEKPVS